MDDHYKATDSHSYLDYPSSHNPSMKNSIPSSQFLRLRRLCSDDTDFEEEAKEMVEFFIQRHYPEDIVRTALHKFRTIPRQQTLQPDDKTATKKRPSIRLLYHPVHQSGTQNHPIQLSLLHSRAELAAIFSQPPLIAYKHDTNIRDMLVRSKLRQPATRTPGTAPCNQAKCGTCPFICTNSNVTVPKSQMDTTKQFNCLTYNIVYVIHCTKYAQLYIGETGRTRDTRFREHLADIKHRRDKPVSKHFNQTGHTIHNIRVKGLWLLFADSGNDRNDMESHLIDKLGSRKPAAMNERYNRT